MKSEIKVSLQVEYVLFLKWLNRLARSKTTSKMDQTCQVYIIPYLLHTARTQLFCSRYNQQAVILVPTPVPVKQQVSALSPFQVVDLKLQVELEERRKKA